MKKHLINGKIYLEKDRFAEALTIEDGVITAVGDAELLTIAPEDSVFDLEGRTVLPGMNDSHMHLSMIGMTMGIANLNPARSIDDVVRIASAFLAEHPETEVMYGRGWNQDFFTSGEKRLLNRQDVDRISTEIPIILTRVCGHVTTTNTKAVEALGITPETKVDGGEIVRDADGVPTGLFNENAISLAESLLPPDTVETIVENLLRAADYAVSVGVTSIQSNDAMEADNTLTFEALHQVVREKKLPLRYSAQVNYTNIDDFRRYLETEFVNDADYDERTFRKGALKLFKDGSLGARTAEMSEDYADDPGNRGVEALTREQLNEMVRLATEHELRVVTHAIGDGAVQSVIDAVVAANGGSENPLRHGIVHCQITHREQLDAIAENNIAVMYQPIFLDYDIRIVTDRVGKELADSSYAFGSMIRRGARVAFGTDSPVEDCNPFPCLDCAVNRETFTDLGSEPYSPAERCMLEDSIDAYTIGSAWNEGTDEFKGRLREGFVADLIVLDRDIFEIDPREIRDVRVLRTMIDGEWVFERE